MKTAVLILAVLAAVTPGAVLAGEKTDLAKEIYVENSETNFALKATHTVAAKGQVHEFKLSAPAQGAYSLLCFVDGRLWSLKAMNLPGTYKLTTRGMVPGTHRVTLQAVDAGGQIGSTVHTITSKK